MKEALMSSSPSTETCWEVNPVTLIHIIQYTRGGRNIAFAS